jgi:hypothetical protein
MQDVLSRLDALEKQNQQLLAEIQSLRHLIQQQNPPATAAASPGGMNQERIQELEQTKVEASQRFPVALTGMVLFDAFDLKGTKSSLFNSTYPDYGLGVPGGGATFNQSLIGLRFDGPEWLGAKTSGFLSMDFYSGNAEYDTFRLRRAGVSFDWGRRRLTFAQDKSLLSPLEPTSYAHIGVPALAGAGNLWLWRPQVRYDEHIPGAADWTATVSGAVLETDENYNGAGALQNRPAAEARIEIRKTSDGEDRFIAGIGGHASTTHVYGQSVSSRLLSIDLKWAPERWFVLTGTAFTGHNFANLGGLTPGISYDGEYAEPVRSGGGWAQLAFPVTRRLTFDVYGGRQVNRASDLTAFQIARTFDIAGNVLYRVAPNVVLGFEAGRDDARYLNGLDFLGKRFDATVAYLF